MQIVNHDIAPVNVFLGTGQAMRLVRIVPSGEAWDAPDSEEMYWADSGKVTFDGQP